MKYKIKILLPNETKEYKAHSLTFRAYDRIAGLSLTGLRERLENPDILYQMANEMISNNFIDEFFFLLDRTPQYAPHYREWLAPIIFAMQFEIVKMEEDFKIPRLMYIEGFVNKDGDYEKYSYITDEWNYQAIIKRIGLHPLAGY